jgi:hypothetical protein
MRFMDGLEEWRSDLRKIYSTDEVRGFEKAFDLVIFFSMIATISQLLQFLFWGRRDRAARWFIDAYVFVATVVLICFLVWPDSFPRVSCFVAWYLLASTVVVLFNVLFLTKLSFIGPVASYERTLLLFLVNIVQVVLAFAILYRLTLPNLNAWKALYESLLVFGTIGYPKGAEPIVGIQIAIDFVLLAVFLAFVVGRLGKSDKRQSENGNDWTEPQTQR